MPISTDSPPQTERFSSQQTWWVWGIAAATAVLHLAVANRYGYFRNELYFIDCGRHPAFGYVDQPPLVPLLAAATQAFGHRLWLLRLPAVAAAALLVPLTAAFAKLFSRRTAVVVTAAAAAALSPALAAITSTLTTATFEPLAWTACAYFIARYIVRRDANSLLWAGVVAGLAMEAKYGIVMWLAGLFLGLLLFDQDVLRTKKLWLGAAIAALIAAPNLVWQTAHHWPFLALIAHHRAIGFDLTGGPLMFEFGQILANNLILAPLWIAGVIAPFVVEELKPARFLAVAFVAATIIDFASHGKDYYLFGVYPVMFAVGAGSLSLRIPRWAVALWLALSAAQSAIVLPVVLPVLAPRRLAFLLNHSDLRPRPDEIAGIGAPLTQVFSDEMGWPQLEQHVAAVYNALPEQDRQKAAIFASSYGEAAAIDFFGRANGLPQVIGGGNQYYLWGPRGADGSVMIVVNGNPDRWRSACNDLQLAGTFGVRLAMPYERDRPILVCRGLHGSLQQMWPDFQRFE
ncbi:MAG TPA: glycosyltransferase family 39 protein [Candidatus Acidoferrum sp.]|nr:glycosyltransferase family 39 protein [Candidatus Acidoferrum sp.]